MPKSVETFRKLHTQFAPLLLPNAWDAGSARLFETLGAKAIATTSGGVAWALGYRDGAALPIDEVVHAVARITRVVKVPVTVDVENGYSHDPRTVAGNVERLLKLGVAGINIEDGEDEPELLSAKIAAIKGMANDARVDLFINARSDVFLRNLAKDDDLAKESIRRGLLYKDAGADGIFLPGVHKRNDVALIVDRVPLPLNVMAWPGLPAAPELAEWGVRRVSAGTAISQVAWSAAEVTAKNFLETGDSRSMNESSVSYVQMQNAFPEN